VRFEIEDDLGRAALAGGFTEHMVNGQDIGAAVGLENFPRRRCGAVQTSAKVRADLPVGFSARCRNQ